MRSNYAQLALIIAKSFCKVNRLKHTPIYYSDTLADRQKKTKVALLVFLARQVEGPRSLEEHRKWTRFDFDLQVTYPHLHPAPRATTR